MASPHERQQVYAGEVDTPYQLPVSQQYEDNVLVFAGVTTGTMTVRAKPHHGTRFEFVVNGAINLEESSTLKIVGYQIDAFEFTLSGVAEATPFTVTAFQYDPVRSVTK